MSLGYILEHLHRVCAVSLSEDPIRRQLHCMDYRYKRPWYLLVPDPLQEKNAL